MLSTRAFCLYLAQYLVLESECLHIGVVQLPNATILSATSPDPASSQGQNIAGRSTPFRILQSEVGQSIDDASPSTADHRWPVLRTRMHNRMNLMMPAEPKSKHSEKPKPSAWLKSASILGKSLKRKVTSIGSGSGRFSRTGSGFSSDGSDKSGRSSSKSSSRTSKSQSGKTKKTGNKISKLASSVGSTVMSAFSRKVSRTGSISSHGSSGRRDQFQDNASMCSRSGSTDYQARELLRSTCSGEVPKLNQVKKEQLCADVREAKETMCGNVQTKISQKTVAQFEEDVRNKYCDGKGKTDPPQTGQNKGESHAAPSSPKGTPTPITPLINIRQKLQEYKLQHEASLRTPETNVPKPGSPPRPPPPPVLEEVDRKAMVANWFLEMCTPPETNQGPTEPIPDPRTPYETLSAEEMAILHMMRLEELKKEIWRYGPEYNSADYPLKVGRIDTKNEPRKPVAPRPPWPGPRKPAQTEPEGPEQQRSPTRKRSPSRSPKSPNRSPNRSPHRSPRPSPHRSPSPTRPPPPPTFRK